VLQKIEHKIANDLDQISRKLDGEIHGDTLKKGNQASTQRLPQRVHAMADRMLRVQ
jgi:hypothetical protein